MSRYSILQSLSFNVTKQKSNSLRQGERKFRMLRDSTHLNLDQIRQFIYILGEIRQFLALRVLGNKYTSHQQTKSLVSLVQALRYYSTVIYCTILYCTVLYCIVLYCTELREPRLGRGSMGRWVLQPIGGWAG